MMHYYLNAHSMNDGIKCFPECYYDHACNARLKRHIMIESYLNDRMHALRKYIEASYALMALAEKWREW